MGWAEDPVTVAAIVRDELGVLIAEPRLNWSSSRPTVVDVDDQGTVSALAVGRSVITASADGVS